MSGITKEQDISPPNEVDESRSKGVIGGLVQDEEATTLYEKKCVLINRQIDELGMGRYQWYIWGLCGFGYMIDLMWAQAFGLVLSPIQQELGFASMACPCFVMSGYLFYQMTRPAISASPSPRDLLLVRRALGCTEAAD